MKNLGQTVMIVVLSVSLLCLGVIAFTYLTNPQAQGQLGHIWAQANEDRQVCKVLGKHTEPDIFNSTDYYLNLNCGDGGEQGDTAVDPNYFNTDISNAAVYESAKIGAVYLMHIDYVKGDGDSVAAALRKTTLPIGHHFTD